MSATPKVHLVTRVAYSKGLNPGKYAQLVEQARRLGVVRSEVWQRYGSINGAGLRDRQVQDQWLADGTHERFGVLANPWKETVRDAVADIGANQEAAKAKAREAVRRHTSEEAERRRPGRQHLHPQPLAGDLPVRLGRQERFVETHYAKDTGARAARTPFHAGVMAWATRSTRRMLRGTV